MTKEKNYYVDKQVLYDDLCEWKIRKDAAIAEGKRPPPLPQSVGEVIITMADRMATRPNFRNYTFIEEMKGDGIVDAVKAMNSFDPERKNKQGQVNPFGFLSLVLWHSFVGRIKHEKAVQAGKLKMMADPTLEHYTQGEEHYDLDAHGAAQFIHDSRND